MNEEIAKEDSEEIRTIRPIKEKDKESIIRYLEWKLEGANQKIRHLEDMNMQLSDENINIWHDYIELSQQSKESEKEKRGLNRKIKTISAIVRTEIRCIKCDQKAIDCKCEDAEYDTKFGSRLMKFICMPATMNAEGDTVKI